MWLVASKRRHKVDLSAKASAVPRSCSGQVLMLHHQQALSGHPDIVPQERQPMWDTSPQACQDDAHLSTEATLILQRLSAQEERLCSILAGQAQRIEEIVKERLTAAKGVAPAATIGGASVSLALARAKVSSTSSKAAQDLGAAPAAHAVVPAIAVTATESNGRGTPATAHETNEATDGNGLGASKSFCESRDVEVDKKQKSTADRAAHLLSHTFVQEEINKLHKEANQVTKSALLVMEDVAAQPSSSILARMVTSHWFEVLVSLTILTNAVVIAFKADEHVRRPLEPLPSWLKVIDTACTVIFVAEISLRLLANGRQFFAPSSRFFKWNIFDFILVLCAVSESLAAYSDFVFLDVSVLRLLGLGRLIRMLPSAQWLRSFSDVRVMLLSISYGLKSVFWAAVVMGFVLLLVAICLMELVAASAEDYQLELGSPLHLQLRDYYGNIWVSIYTVYLCITGGLDWGEAADPLFEVSEVCGIIFCAFIAFSQLCLLNVMTGVFVENASVMAQRDEDTMMLYELEMRKQWVQQVAHVFQAVNKGKSGSLNKEEFMAAMGEVRIQLLLQKLGIDIHAHRPESLFSLFDYDGNGSVEIEEFASALQHFHGQARSVDIAKLKYNVRSVARHVKNLEHILLHGVPIPKKEGTDSRTLDHAPTESQSLGPISSEHSQDPSF